MLIYWNVIPDRFWAYFYIKKELECVETLKPQVFRLLLLKEYLLPISGAHLLCVVDSKYHMQLNAYKHLLMKNTIASFSNHAVLLQDILISVQTFYVSFIEFLKFYEDKETY